MKRIGFILVVMIALMVCSCRGTKVVTIDVPKIEKEYVVSTDTVHQYDSVFVFNDRYVQKDTIYITKVSERYKYLYKVRVDTLLKCDTVTIVNKEQIKALTDENDALKAVGYFYRYLCLCLLVIIALMGLRIFFKK